MPHDRITTHTFHASWQLQPIFVEWKRNKILMRKQELIRLARYLGVSHQGRALDIRNSVMRFVDHALAQRRADADATTFMLSKGYSRGAARRLIRETNSLLHWASLWSRYGSLDAHRPHSSYPTPKPVPESKKP